MLGQPQQNAAPPAGDQSLEDWAFEQRTAGPYSYRAASADWRKIVLATLDKWYATDKPRVVEGVDRYPVASLVGMPPMMGTAGRSTGAEIVQQMVDSGGGVVFLPEGYKGTLVRVELAAEAQKLTASDPTKTAVVLNEPANGWADATTVAIVARYAAFPAGLAAGFVVALSVMGAIQR
jgi:hypothetical protein